MKSLLPRDAEFAWPEGDAPGELLFKTPVSETLRNALFPAMAGYGYEAREIAALSAPHGAAGRYRVEGKNGSWFVRISTRWESPELEQTITAYLREAGVEVNHPEVAGASFTFDGTTYRLDIRPLLHARHFNGSLEDIRSTASLLHRAHDALRNFPHRDTVRLLAAKRFAGDENMLQQMKQWAAEGMWSRFHPDAAWAKEQAPWFEKMLAEFRPRFDQDTGAQVLHAQVHRGNVVYRISDGQPVLLDFEKAVDTYAVPGWDWAYFIQRFCLFKEPDEKLLKSQLNAMREVAEIPSGLVHWMRQIAWMSMTILVGDYALRGISAAHEEFMKFIRLEQQALRYADLLGDLA